MIKQSHAHAIARYVWCGEDCHTLIVKGVKPQLKWYPRGTEVHDWTELRPKSDNEKYVFAELWKHYKGGIRRGDDYNKPARETGHGNVGFMRVFNYRGHYIEIWGSLDDIRVYCRKYGRNPKVYCKVRVVEYKTVGGRSVGRFSIFPAKLQAQIYAWIIEPIIVTLQREGYKFTMDKVVELRYLSRIDADPVPVKLDDKKGTKVVVPYNRQDLKETLTHIFDALHGVIPIEPPHPSKCWSCRTAKYCRLPMKVLCHSIDTYTCNYQKGRAFEFRIVKKLEKKFSKRLYLVKRQFMSRFPDILVFERVPDGRTGRLIIAVECKSSRRGLIDFREILRLIKFGKTNKCKVFLAQKDGRKVVIWNPRNGKVI